MKKIVNHIVVFLIVFTTLCVAQERIVVNGKVVSAEDNTAIVGASVLVLNTTIGVATNADGKFILKNVPIERKAISISAVGFKTTTITLSQITSKEILVSLSPSLIQTQTVVVTANKRQQSLEEVPVSMSIISAKQFEQRNTFALDDALRYVPGVNFQQSQINIRASSGYSRGVGSRVMMLVDGVPLLSGDTGEITFESIPVFQIERVEVVKGAGSALYGSGALGGVINVLTKEIENEPKFWWRTYGGLYSQPEYDQWKWSDKTRFLNGQTFGYSTRWENFGIAASIQRISDDGYREQDWLRRYSGFIKAKYDLSPFQSITFTSNLFQQFRGDFLWWKDLKNALRPADAQRNIFVSSMRFNNSLQYKHFVDEDLYFEIKGVHFRGNWYRDSLKNKRLDASISDAIVVDAQGNLAISNQNTLTFGLVGNAERVRSNIFGVHDGSGGAVYLQDEHKISNDISVTAGLRYDVQRIIGLSTNQQVNPKIGFRYTINEYHTLRASVGRGFRAPSIGEIYTSTANTGSAAIIIPSLNLKPEHSVTYEAGSSSVLTENIKTDIAFFHSDFNDLIEANVQGDTALKAVTVNFKNITQAQIQGFETSVMTNFLENSLQVDIHYNYNWAIDAKTKSFLRFRPRHIFSVNAQFAFDLFSFGADYRYTSRIEAIDDKLVELAPVKNGSQRVAIHLVDTRIIGNLTQIGLPFRASLNINNILGYNYNELIGNISPPRHFMITLEGIIH